MANLPKWLLPRVGSSSLAATTGRQLNRAVSNLQFTSFTDLNDSCLLARVTVLGNAMGRLSIGAGYVHCPLLLILTRPRLCNIIDGPGVFGSDNGMIFTHSHYANCAINGLRIATTCQITRRTGARQGATEGGRELARCPAAVTPALPASLGLLFHGSVDLQGR